MGCCNSNDKERHVTFGRHVYVRSFDPKDDLKGCVPRYKSTPYPEDKYVSELKMLANHSNGSTFSAPLQKIITYLRMIKYLKKLLKKFSDNKDTIFKELHHLAPNKFDPETATEKEVRKYLDDVYKRVKHVFTEKFEEEAEQNDDSGQESCDDFPEQMAYKKNLKKQRNKERKKENKKELSLND